MTSNPILILLIDDQPLVAAAVRRLLASAPDMTLNYCADPAKAETEAATASVVMVDLVMPGVSGLDVVRRLRGNAATAAMPIIVMSSAEDANTKAEAFAAGADDYVVKLPDAVELVARLRALLRRAGR